VFLNLATIVHIVVYSVKKTLSLENKFSNSKRFALSNFNYSNIFEFTIKFLNPCFLEVK